MAYQVPTSQGLDPETDFEPGDYRGETDQLLKMEDMTRLHALSLRLASTHSLSDVLDDVLRTASDWVGARLGTVQLLTSEGDLGMVGEVGFGRGVVDAFSTVRLEDCSTCAEALRKKSRVIVPNLRADPKYTVIAAALVSYGAVAAVSTPVLDSHGKVLAMFSVYWLDEHAPSERELRILDLCADLAGRHVERNFAARAFHDRQALLLRELAHRGKNLLAVIHAIASQSFKSDRPLDEAKAAFFGRLEALAGTYDTFAEDAPESASLRDLVTGSLKSFSDQMEVRGPDVEIGARAAQTLTLVFHELATNAVKYGALSVPAGRVEVAWELLRAEDGAERLRLAWTESGGPPVASPARRGFGSAIITSVAGKDLKCSPLVEYAALGFRYRFECPSRALSGDA